MQTMMARVSFGLRGMWLPIFFQVMSNMVFVCTSSECEITVANVMKFGLQAVYGGQAIGLMLSAIFPQYKNMENTLPVRYLVSDLQKLHYTKRLRDQ